MEMKRISLCLGILLALTACRPGGTFNLQPGEDLTVTLSVDEPVAESALGIFGKDVQTVLSATCREVDRDGKILLVRSDDPAYASDPDVAVLAGRHEAFLMKVLPSGQLLIAGSDGHGAAYGLLELSRMLGVSPWEWWADCSPAPRKGFHLKKGFKLTREPSVAYRGIFINDEDFAFVPWVTGTFEPTGGSDPGRTRRSSNCSSACAPIRSGLRCTAARCRTS